MTPLLDADIILHECGWGGQPPDEDGEPNILSFETVKEFTEEKIKLICEDAGATEPPILFFTDSQWLADKEGREYVPNFRYKVATQKPYKGTRKAEKPFHYYNLLVDLMATYEHVIDREKGLEADDMMGIQQNTEAYNADMEGFPYVETIICSRDKDLRMVPGWHYSWECGRQGAYGPTHTDELGWVKERSVSGKRTGKIVGFGKSFLFYQMLVGDGVDNIPGIKGVGPKKALSVLSDCRNVESMYNTVMLMYNKHYGKDGWYVFKEMGDLLFIRHDDRDFMQYMKGLMR